MKLLSPELKSNRVIIKIHSIYIEFKKSIRFWYRSKLKKSYSQGKEDIVLAGLFNYKREGFYVDVGASRPVKLSNTYLFYKLGWKGICLEPNGKLVNNYKKVRPRDIIIETAASNFVGEAKFFTGDNKYDVNSSLSDPKSISISKTINVKVDKMENILNAHNVQEIDFISIDTEGTELDVLEGLNLDRFRPKYILVEHNTAYKINHLLQPYMISKGYQVIYINQWNMIFADDFQSVINCYN